MSAYSQGLGNETVADKNYKDLDGNPCTLLQLIRKDPEWAENWFKSLQAELKEAHIEIAIEKEKIASLILRCLEIDADNGTLKEKLKTIRAELDAAKKDTVRLDWMEQNNLNLIKNGYATMGLVCPITKVEKSVRAVIDAAMEELEEKVRTE